MLKLHVESSAWQCRSFYIHTLQVNHTKAGLVKYKLEYNSGHIWLLCEGHPEKPALCDCTGQCHYCTVPSKHSKGWSLDHAYPQCRSISRCRSLKWHAHVGLANISFDKLKDLHLIGWFICQYITLVASGPAGCIHGRWALHLMLTARKYLPVTNWDIICSLWCDWIRVNIIIMMYYKTESQSVTSG